MALDTHDAATDQARRAAELCADFVARVVAEGREVAARQHPEGAVPDVDWESIWRAGDGAPNLDRAVGQVVSAAFVAARQIAGAATVLPKNGALAGITRVGAPPPLALPTGTVIDPITEQITISPAGSRKPATGPPNAAVPVTPLTVPKVGVPGLVTTPVRVGRLAGVVRTKELALAPPRWATVFTWVRNVGAIVLLFVAWQLWGTAIGEHHEQSALRSQFEAAVHAHHRAPTTGGSASAAAAAPTLLPAGATVAVPAEGSVLAELNIPAIGVDQFVVSGTATADLAKGPGHYTGTAMPGQAGNVVIAGHRTTHGAPFNRLGDIVVGDKIILTTLSGVNLTYVVAQTPFPVSPSDVTVLNDFGDNRITLTTCNPEFSAAQRLIVVAKLVQNGPAAVAAPAVKAKPIEYHLLNPATASWNWGLLPAVMLEAALLVALGLFLRRSIHWYGRFGQWLILTPIWLAGLYLLFQSLTSFLPASI
jgi:sortase A